MKTRRWADRHLYIMVGLAVILTIVAFVMMVKPVGAVAIALPDSTPTLNRVNVYRNLLETGDYCYIFSAKIPYATAPAIPVSDAFIWRLISTDGTTTLGSTVGYAFFDSGYNDNVYSMYFSAADATAVGLVWGTAYILRLAGNPTAFTTAPTYNYTIAAGQYTTLTTSAANKAALATEILWLAEDLNTKWALATASRLTIASETGTVLSVYGEIVFRGSVFGCQSLAPTAFGFVVLDVTPPNRAFNGSYNASLEGQYAGTWVEAARNSSRDLLGTGYDLVSLIILLAICLALVLVNLSLTNDHWNGIVDVAFLLVIAARMGIYSLVYLILIGAICIIFLGTKVWKMIPT